MSYRFWGLVVVALAVGLAVGFKVGQHSCPAPAKTVVATCDTTCYSSAEEKSKVEAAPPPKIPPPSGLPALVEFGSDECKQCRRMKQVLAQLKPKLSGAVEVIEVDTDIYEDLATTWRLRIIPTQIIVSHDGKELFRHEGFWAPEEIVAQLKALGLLKR